MEEFSFTRYLEAKRSVDDRALNQRVWGGLRQAVRADTDPVQVLEIGCGTGAMLRRLLEQGLLRRGRYHGIDAVEENLACARDYFLAWAEERGFPAQVRGERLLVSTPEGEVEANFELCELDGFLDIQAGRESWDVILAHAFLDLVDIPRALPRLLPLARPGGLFCFTINFDGLTALEPAVDPRLDDRILALYHRTMDERLVAGRPAGDSRSGRHLFTHLRQPGYELLEAGSSDWVVFSRQGRYAGDEAYFLHFMLYFIEGALRGCPELDPQQFSGWLDARRAQIERGELVLIAHQLDFLARRSLP